MFNEFNTRDPNKTPDCKILNIEFNHYNENNKHLKFVHQDENLPFQKLGYEQRIYLHGLIATREKNWHDFFNAMVWHNFPLTKSVINAIHFEEIQLQNGPIRSRKRDLLTLFDECGVIVIADNYFLQLIKSHKWRELFVEHRKEWLDNQIQVITFGHAMYEKYLSPYIGMTAKALLYEPIDTNIDDFLASQIISRNVLNSKKDLAPLPMLGIPNWHSNQNLAFYANQQYFR